jgi:hypothetical protein
MLLSRDRSFPVTTFNGDSGAVLGAYHPTDWPGLDLWQILYSPMASLDAKRAIEAGRMAGFSTEPKSNFVASRIPGRVPMI